MRQPVSPVGLAVPGDVAGSQADQHVVHVQWWSEHGLKKGREGSAVPTGELETGPQTLHRPTLLPFLPSFCLTPIRAQMLISRWEHQA